MLRGLTRLAEAHVDRAQQEAPFDGLIFVGRPGLLQERQRVLEAPGFHQKTTGRQIRISGPVAGGSAVSAGSACAPTAIRAVKAHAATKTGDPGMRTHPRPRSGGLGLPCSLIQQAVLYCCLAAPNRPLMTWLVDFALAVEDTADLVAVRSVELTEHRSFEPVKVIDRDGAGGGILAPPFGLKAVSSNRPVLDLECICVLIFHPSAVQKACPIGSVCIRSPGL